MKVVWSRATAEKTGLELTKPICLVSEAQSDLPFVRRWSHVTGREGMTRAKVLSQKLAGFMLEVQ